MKLKILLIVLVSLSFLNFDYITEDIKKYLDIVLILYFFVDLLKHHKNHEIKRFRYIVVFLMALPFVSAIPCFIYRHQSIFDSVFVTRTELLWLFYFYLFNNKIRPQVVIEVIATIGILGGLIALVQQFTYPTFAYWGTISHFDSGDLDMRNGIYRFEINNTLYSLFGFYYYLYKIGKETGRKKNIILMLLCLLGVVLKMSRQFWFVTFSSIIIYIFIASKLSKTKKIVVLLLFALIALLIIPHIGAILGDDVVEMTDKQLNDDSYVRWVAYSYFGLEYWETPLNVLLGNGVPRRGVGSPYANDIDYVTEVMGLYRSDIGVVGVFSMYGAIFILVILFLYYALFKYWRNYPAYIKIAIIASIVSLPLECWVTGKIFMSMFLYLSDRSIECNSNTFITKNG